MFAEQNWNDNNGWSFADAYPDDVRVVLSTQQDALRLFTDDGSIANPFGEAATKACEAQITVEIFVPRGEGYVRGIHTKDGCRVVVRLTKNSSPTHDCYVFDGTGPTFASLSALVGAVIGGRAPEVRHSHPTPCAS